MNSAKIIKFPSAYMPHININELKNEMEFEKEIIYTFKCQHVFCYKEHLEKLGIELATVFAKFYDESHMYFHRYMLAHQPKNYNGDFEIWNLMWKDYRNDFNWWYKSSYKELSNYFDYLTKKKLVSLIDKLVNREVLVRTPYPENQYRFD